MSIKGVDAQSSTLFGRWSSRSMATLHHYPFCPHSRFARLALAEHGIAVTLVEEKPWERRQEFLVLNPAGTLPVFIDDTELVVTGAGGLAAFVSEAADRNTSAQRLMPDRIAARVEVRRLLDWFNGKFFEEVSGYLVGEKIHKRYIPAGAGGGSPDMAAIRAARNNIRYHLRYIGFLLGRRNCLAGDELTYADLAAAAHLSCVDYLGDVPWDENEAARQWYARMKSRPAFRALLSDRVAGMAPAESYADLDF
jgi:glutathione S-transferase